jgi:hypothetical protein
VDELKSNRISPASSNRARNRWCLTPFHATVARKKGEEQQQKPAVPEKGKKPLIEESVT